MQLARRIAHVLFALVALVVGAAAAVAIVSQTTWFRTWLRGYIVHQAGQYLNGQLSIERLDGNLFFGMELANIRLSMDGRQIVAVKDLVFDYNLFGLISTGVSVDNIRLKGPVLDLRHDGQAWSISRIIKQQAQEAGRQGPIPAIAVNHLGITDGSLTIEGPAGPFGLNVPKRLDHLNATMSFKYEPLRYSIEITQASFLGSDPPIELDELSGKVTVSEDTLVVSKLSLRTEETGLAADGTVHAYLTKPVFSLQVSSSRLSLPEIARLVPALAGSRLQPAFELRLSGPADRLRIGLNVRSPAGEATADVVADLLAPEQSLVGDVSVRRLDLAPIVNRPDQKSDVTASAHVDLRAASVSDLDSVRGSVRLSAPRIVAAGVTAGDIAADAHIQGGLVDFDGRGAAYGAKSTAAGRLVLPQGRRPLSYVVHGLARQVDLSRFPHAFNLQPADHALVSNLNVNYLVTGAAPTPGGPGRIPGAAATIRCDLRFLESSVAGVRIARGSAAAFSLDGDQIGYEGDATVAGLDLQEIGGLFGVAVSSRYRSSINGHIVASGRGTKPEVMNLTANGTLMESSIAGGRIPRLTFDARLANNTAQVKVNGELAGFDPATLGGAPAAKGEVAAAVDLDATLSGVSSGLSADRVQATAKINLHPSMIGSLAIASASLDGGYHDSTVVIRALDVEGHAITVSAAGMLALGEAGRSSVTFHAVTPGLDEIGKLIDRPLEGMATMDGTVTGNRRELRASGHLVADNLGYGETSALTVSTDYVVTIADLMLAHASFGADTAATFVTVAGQTIDEVHAKAQYANQAVDFDATARQSERSLEAAGSLLLQPGRQEVRLDRFGVQAQGTSWKLAPESAPAIRHGDGAVTVDGLQLVSGTQRIAAGGAFGRPGDVFRISFEDVDLAGVDQVTLRPSQFTGRLSASSTITGTIDAPHLNAEFRINQGGFRQFHYDTLIGTAEYGGRGITLDTRLQQSPTTFMTAKGYVPVALFHGGASSGPDGTVPPEDRIDLHIDSSPIDLGIVQGFTTALTKVGGALQATVDVGGSAGDLRPTGTITVQDGVLTVAPTGVSYTGLHARIDLQPDRVHIVDISVLDDRRKPLRVTGDLAIRERQVGGFNVTVKADDFKVIGNKMGSVRVHTDLRVTGELDRPRIEGDLNVIAGTINLDPILAAMGGSAYATTPIGDVTFAGSSGPGAPGAFETLQLDVHVTAAKDLIVKGSDLQAADSAVGLGSLNLTLGGDLWASKAPYDQFRLTGVVNTVRGTYEFQGRRFDILRDGTVRFEGLDELDPSLDIKTERVIQAVTARVNIRGTLRKPEIVLSSIPPLEDADILALIVFNQQLNQLGEGQQISLAQRAQALAAGAVASRIATSVGNRLGLDQFEITTAPPSGAAAEVTVGQQVGRNLYMKLEQAVGGETQTNLILEYELEKWLRLRTNVLEGTSSQQQLFQHTQDSGADLIIFFSF
jgi:autotransporter translocation and assembly factor TamB